MLIVFNIGIILLVLLIAYWWANQGVFSALLHLVSVLVAGAVAFGLWEPIVVGLLLRGGWFDNYAWGFGLVIPFVVTLFALRFSLDKLAPGNVDLPHWANLAFVFPIGLAAGIITMGITVIGCGFMQSHSTIMGYQGYGVGRSGTVGKFSDSMWFPVHMLTGQVYNLTSTTSMWTTRPMAHTNPRIHWQASLMRASAGEGKGAVSLAADAARVTDYFFESGTAVVKMHFDAAAMDFGDQLTISAGQIRLIADARGVAVAKVAHPSTWVQDGTLYRFDDASHYIISTMGRESADAAIIFDLDPTFVPKYIQVKGTRFRLPQASPMPSIDELSLPSAGEGGSTAIDAGAGSIQSVIEISNSIRPVRVSSNRLPGSITEKDKLLVEGVAEFMSGAPSSISRQLIITGVYEAPGTRCVMLEVSRGTAADVFSKSVVDNTQPTDRLALVDSNGNAYTPLGYKHHGARSKITIKLAPGVFVKTLGELPPLPTSGDQQLFLYFRVTEGSTITGFKVGDRTIGTCNLPVEKK
jgi:hypothetical protein